MRGPRSELALGSSAEPSSERNTAVARCSEPIRMRLRGPALADLANEGQRDVAREADDAERGELERQQPLRLRSIEPVEGGEDLCEAIVRCSLPGDAELLELGVAEPGQRADAVARIGRRLQQAQPFEIRRAIASRAAGSANRLDDSVTALPGAQQLRREAGEPRSRSERVGHLDRGCPGLGHGGILLYR